VRELLSVVRLDEGVVTWMLREGQTDADQHDA
jgi:hypothetical protein